MFKKDKIDTHVIDMYLSIFQNYFHTKLRNLIEISFN